MATLTKEFGYYPIACDFVCGDISIATNKDLAHIVKHIEQSPSQYKDWIYPPSPYKTDIPTGTATTLPYPSRIFGLPKTHTFSHQNGDSEEHLHFLIWCMSFFTGMRLTATEAGFLDATPIKPGKLTDFSPLHKKLSDALSISDEFWKRHLSKPRAAKRLSGIIHALYMAQYPQSLCFEQFIYLYSALDGCFALTKDIVGGPQRNLPHADRLEWMCNQFQMPVPTWASSTSHGSEVSVVRNSSIHESLFFDEPLGFAIYGGNAAVVNRVNVTLEMQALVCRLVVALLGRPNCSYAKSVVTSYQLHLLDI